MSITVSDTVLRIQPNFWTNIHFHPADAIEDAWGQEYLNTVAENGAARTVRMYSMLEDIVTRDESGSLRYDFTENDVRMDYMVRKGFNLLVSYGFFPPCISAVPDAKICVEKAGSRYKGKFVNSEPPAEYDEWEEICYQYTRHIVERYGLDTVKNWYLQCYNEPDGNFLLRRLRGQPDAEEKRCEEYKKIYRGFALGCARVSKELKIGGPAATRAPIMEALAKYATENHLKIDFLCGHSYGTNPARLNDGTGLFDPQNHIQQIQGYQDIADRYFPDGIELVIDEWGASSMGMFDVNNCPALLLRETSAYAAYYGRMIALLSSARMPSTGMMICLSGSHQVHQEPGRFPEFTGFRSFFTEHFIRKPIFNAFILGSKLHEQVLDSQSDDENQTVYATTDGCDKSVMVSYAPRHFDKALPDQTGVLETALKNGTWHVTSWVIDENHAAPYQLAQKKHMPAFPSEDQLAELKDESILRPVYDSVDKVTCGRHVLPYTMTNNGLMLTEYRYTDEPDEAGRP